PPEKEGNPILQICELILFPKFGKMEIKRPDKFGGNVEFTSYEELENSYLDKNLHAADLKNSVAEALIELLEPVRG
ncbi:MAG: tyrosine--tRNA ligase, partial [Candidatus Altiarchaeota archaeon]|nr:tyrosine--tRNA ligase [Candidatus Altiarchaeota archaeon]